MAGPRTLVTDFSLANPLYADAVVTFFTVDPVLLTATTTLQTLYEDLTTANTLPNPQTLDGSGKFTQPIYVNSATIMKIGSTATVPSSTTGIVGPLGSFKGNWAPSVLYVYGDIVIDGPAGAGTGNLYYSNGIFTSSPSFSADLAAGDWSIYVNVAAAALAAVGSITVFNVKTYGAKGDGVTDDTAAIQAAMTAGAGATVYLPLGIYYVNVNSIKVSSNTLVRGDGPGSVLKAGPTWPNGGAYGYAVVFCNLNYGSSTLTDSNITFRDLLFDGRIPYAITPTWGNAIEMDYVTNALVENCVFLSFSTCTRMISTSFTTIRDCYSDTTWNAAWDHFKGPAHAKVVNNVAVNLQGYGTLWTGAGPAGPYGIDADDFLCDGNYFRFSASPGSSFLSAIYTGALGGTGANQQFVRWATITNNQMDMNGTSMNGIVCSGSPGGVIVTDNRIFSTATPVNSWAGAIALIEDVSGAAGATPDNSIVANNYVDNYECTSSPMFNISANYCVLMNNIITSRCTFPNGIGGSGTNTIAIGNQFPTGTSTRTYFSGTTPLYIDCNNTSQTWSMNGILNINNPGGTILPAFLVFNGNSAATYPTATTPGQAGGTIGSNFSGGGAEVNHWNTLTTASISHNWWQLTGASSGLKLMELRANGTLQVNSQINNGNGLLLNANANGANYPDTGTGMAITANFSAGSQEVDFFNTATGASLSYAWYQKTGASAASLLAYLNPNGQFVAGSLSAGSGAFTVNSSGQTVATKYSSNTNNAIALTSQTSGAASSAGTLTNAPSAGNPNFWLPITINGTTRYIPAW